MIHATAPLRERRETGSSGVGEWKKDAALCRPAPSSHGGGCAIDGSSIVLSFRLGGGQENGAWEPIQDKHLNKD